LRIVQVFDCQHNFEYTLITLQCQRIDLPEAEDTRIKAVITGGTGFIGSHTVEELLRLGFSVTCLVRPGRKDPGWLQNLPVLIRTVDFVDVETLSRVLADADYLFHVAGVTKARNTREYRIGNVDTTRALLDASEKSGRLRKFCFVSSLTASGPSNDGRPRREDDPHAPITAYGRSKREAEEVCRDVRGLVPSVIIRPPAVYGPRDRDILEMFRWVQRGIAPIMGPRQKTLSLIHVTDLARGIVEATLSDRTTGNTYFIANQQPYAYTDLLTLAAEILGKNIAFLKIPTPLIYATAAVVQVVSGLTSQAPILNLDKVRDLVAPHWTCDSGRLRADIAFSERIPIEEGFRSTIRWYQSQRWL